MTIDAIINEMKMEKTNYKTIIISCNLEKYEIKVRRLKWITYYEVVINMEFELIGKWFLYSLAIGLGMLAGWYLRKEYDLKTYLLRGGN